MVDLLKFFIFGQEPVIVDVVLRVRRDVNRRVLFVKLLLSLLTIEFRKHWWFLVCLFIFVLRAGLLTILLLLQTILLFLPLVVDFDVFLVGFNELGLLVSQVLLTIALAFGFGLLTTGFLFSILLLDGLAPDHIQLASRYGHFEPLEEFTKALVILVDCLLVQVTKRLLNEVDALVSSIIVFFLAPDLVIEHFFG